MPWLARLRLFWEALTHQATPYKVTCSHCHKVVGYFPTPEAAKAAMNEHSWAAHGWRRN